MEEKTQSAGYPQATAQESMMAQPATASEMESTMEEPAEKADTEAETPKESGTTATGWSEEEQSVFAEALRDPAFAEFARGKEAPGQLSRVLERYRAWVKEAETRGERRAAQEAANRRATPGALSGACGQASPLYTREQVAAMTPEQVSQNYTNIRASMRYWN